MMRSMMFKRVPRIAPVAKQCKPCKCATTPPVPHAKMSLTQKIDMVKSEIASLESSLMAVDASGYDVLEELYVCLADLKIRHQAEKGDPLIEFCLENPDADECKMYDV